MSPITSAMFAERMLAWTEKVAMVVSMSCEDRADGGDAFEALVHDLEPGHDSCAGQPRANSDRVPPGNVRARIGFPDC